MMKQYISTYSVLLVGLLVAAAGVVVTGQTTTATDENLKVLMVGNSYMISNDMQNMLLTMLREYDSQSGISGYMNHGGQLENNVEDFGSTLDMRDYWTHVVLQEQSQIPALWDCCAQNFEPSLEAFQDLDDQIRTYNDGNSAVDDAAETVLFMTWGRRNGDPSNLGYFPDFLTMNGLLEEGYLLVRDELQKVGKRPIKIAPVGLAFQKIYEMTLEDLMEEHGSEAGDDILDPTADGTDFNSLYSDDGSHPSVVGTYLGALVLYATLTGEDPSSLEYYPDATDKVTGLPMITEAYADYLQAVAQLTVEEFRAEHEQPTSAPGPTPAPVVVDQRANECPPCEDNGGFLVCKDGNTERCLNFVSPLTGLDTCGACPTPRPTGLAVITSDTPAPTPVPPPTSPAPTPTEPATDESQSADDVTTEDDPTTDADPIMDNSTTLEPDASSVPTRSVPPTSSGIRSGLGVVGISSSYFIWFMTLGAMIFSQTLFHN